MKKLLAKSITPGELPQDVAIYLAYALIVSILALDIVAPSTVSLRILYVFPLAIFSIHVENRVHLIVGVAAIAVGMVFSIFQLPLPLLARYAQSILGTAAFVFVGYLIRVGRRRYLEIQRLATHDVLTGLKNRQALITSLEAEIERMARYGTQFSLAIIDLDGFKLLNDSRGHDQGDAALEIVAQIMSTTTRRTDTLARIGGDEFALLMPNTGLCECERSCLMLVDRIGSGMAIAGYAITASVGAVAIDKPPTSVGAAIKRADEAMYLAKKQGKARAVVV